QADLAGDRLAEVGQGLVVAAQRGQGDAAPAVGLAQVGVQAQGGGEVGDGGLVVAAVDVCGGAEQGEPAVARVAADGLVVVGERPVEVAQVHPGDRPVAVGEGAVGGAGEGGVEVGQGLPVAALLVEHDPAIVVRRGVVGAQLDGAGQVGQR